MRHVFPACASLLSLGLANVAAAATATASVSASGFTLSSSDPQLSRHLPQIYAANAFGCSGGNSSPPLAWHHPPAGTKSFVITLFGRDPARGCGRAGCNGYFNGAGFVAG
jgi:hypothetical protein